MTAIRPIKGKSGIVALLAIVCLFQGCAPTKGGKRFAWRIEQAHDLEKWEKQQAIQTEMTLSFRGNQLFDGTMTFDYRHNRVRMDEPGKGVMIFDGSNAWASGDWPPAMGARFHTLTWPYFLAVPFKLSDPGTHLHILGRWPYRGESHQVAKLTFESGVGDAPDDWYIIYRDPATDRIAAMSYIVTYGPKTVADAEAEPHAITYDDYEKVKGAWVSTWWRFYDWNEDDGVHGEPIGEVKLSNLRFVDPEGVDFTPPAGATEDKLPGT